MNLSSGMSGSGGPISTPFSPQPGAPSGVPGTQQNGGGGSSDTIPGAALYAQAAAAAREAYGKALANINGQRTTALQQYGYMAVVDPKTGVIKNMKVDPNNPYGLYQQMLGNHGQSQEEARYAADRRGLGHIGLGAQGVSADQRSFGADSSNLSQNLMGQLEGFQSQQNSAEEQMQSALWQAELTQAEMAIQNQGFNQADVSAQSTYGRPINPGLLAYAHNAFTRAAKTNGPSAVRVSANKTGASRDKRGIFSIH